MTGELCILDETGDTKIMWDVENEDEVDNAREQFDRLIEKGYTAYEVKKDGSKGKVMKKFNPEAGKIILVPLLAGG